MRIRALVTSLFLIVVLIFGCGTPFFPETGVPPAEIIYRSTPEGVVLQLVKSYESRRIDKFEDLLYSEEEFRFYVELNDDVYSGLNNISTDRTEFVDLDGTYIFDGSYVYLTYDEEKSIHEKLFSQSSAISFDEPLSVMSVLYLKSLDGSAATDSSGAEYAIVRTDNASIRITSDIIMAAYGEQAHSFAVGRQIFYLKKDSEGLWSILYWFELSV
jgi:hypothetical protein